MRFKLEFNCETSAFYDNPNEEITRLLRHISEHVAYGKTEGVIQDYNGNTIGSFRLIGKENRP